VVGADTMYRSTAQCVQDGCVFRKRTFYHHVCDTHSISHICLPSVTRLTTCLYDDHETCLVSGLAIPRIREPANETRMKHADTRSIVAMKYSRSAFADTLKKFMEDHADAVEVGTDLADANSLLESNITRMYYLFHRYRGEHEHKRVRPETLLAILDNMMTYICFAVLEDKVVDQKKKLYFQTAMNKINLRKNRKQDVSKLLTADRVWVRKRIIKPLFEADAHTKRLQSYITHKHTGLGCRK
jgi:hypothetical protein